MQDIREGSFFGAPRKDGPTSPRPTPLNSPGSASPSASSWAIVLSASKRCRRGRKSRDLNRDTSSGQGKPSAWLHSRKTTAGGGITPHLVRVGILELLGILVILVIFNMMMAMRAPYQRVKISKIPRFPRFQDSQEDQHAPVKGETDGRPTGVTSHCFVRNGPRSTHPMTARAKRSSARCRRGHDRSVVKKEAFQATLDLR
jgi:hypothetical protein